MVLLLGTELLLGMRAKAAASWSSRNGHSSMMKSLVSQVQPCLHPWLTSWLASLRARHLTTDLAPLWATPLITIWVHAITMAVCSLERGMI